MKISNLVSFHFKQMSRIEMSLTNAYEILGLSSTATSEEVKSAYKVLALKVHPDKNRDDPNAAEKFTCISNAHERIMVHLERAEEDQEDEFADDDDYENDDDDNDSSSQNHNRRRMNEVFDFVANVGTRGGMSEREFYEFMFYELFHENVGANTDPARWTQQHDFYTRQREKERQELARERERKNAARRKLRDPLREHSAGTIKTCRRCAERYLPKADQRCDACGAAEPVLQTRLDEEKERAKATKKEKQGKKSSV